MIIMFFPLLISWPIYYVETIEYIAKVEVLMVSFCKKNESLAVGNFRLKFSSHYM